MVTQGQLPALGSCHPPGLSRAAKGVETEIGHGRWDSQSLPSPGLDLCAAWGPEAEFSPVCSGPTHLFRGSETWVWAVVKPNIRAYFCCV